MTSRFWTTESILVRAMLIAYRDRSWVPDQEKDDKYFRFSHKAGLAGALRALADHRPQARTLDGPQDHWDPDDRTRLELRNIADELESRA